MHNIFNFKWCRAVSVVPTFKAPVEPPPKPAKPKHIIIPWGKIPLIPKGLEKQTIEQEMMRLHYTYRKMEASQRHFHEESELVLRRQKSMLETLQFDNKMTQDKIDLFYPKDFAEEMRRLNAECAMWIEKIESEIKRVEELENATHTLYDDEYSSKKTMGGVNAAREHSQATQIHIHILEKRVYKAMQDLTIIQWHNKLMQDEMQNLRVEHELFEELHAKMEIELQKCQDEMDDTINKSYELYDERHDYHKLISEILEMMEEGDAYTRWQTYGTWIGSDGRPLAETALASEKERTERLKNKRPTLPLTNEMDLKKMFVLEGTEARLKFRSKPHTKKYEQMIEVKAFLNTQQLLGLQIENIDQVLPMLVAAQERHAQLVRDVQMLNAEIEEAIRFKLGRFANEDGDWDLKDTNDFLEIIRELKRQIFLVFREAGCLGWDPDLENKIKAGAIEEDSSLEEAISKLFVKTEEFIVQMSAPIGFGPVTPEVAPSVSPPATADSASS